MECTVEEIKNIFIKQFGDMARLAASQLNIWKDLIDYLPYAPACYTLGSLNYQHAYMSAFVDELIDLSVVLFQKNSPIGLWPISLRKKAGLYEFCTNQGPVLPPVYRDGTSDRIIKKYNSQCLKAVSEFYESMRDAVPLNNTWSTCASFLPCKLHRQNVLWDSKCMELGATPQVVHDLYVDLGLTLEEIHANIRKSYRSLLNEGEKLWHIEVHDNVSDALFNEFRLLHKDVSGRVTRPKETWDLQRDDTNKNNSFLVTLRDNKQRLCGGGLFGASATESVYAVGVYDRNLFDKPVSHIVQWTAIKHAKELGLKWHYVGQRFYETDKPTPTAKELQIAYFKEGFATDVCLKLILKMVLTGGE